MARAGDTVLNMVGVDELQAQVLAGYDRLGLPSWSDPHPGFVLPRDDEYSRVTDPGRSRIVHARARVWADRLGDLPGVHVEPLAPDRLVVAAHPGWFGRGFQITSYRPGRLPLLLLEWDAPGSGRSGSLSVLQISVARPEVAVTQLPECGCDAC